MRLITCMYLIRLASRQTGQYSIANFVIVGVIGFEEMLIYEHYYIKDLMQPDWSSILHILFFYSLLPNCLLVRTS